jgi:hypothetical protein
LTIVIHDHHSRNIEFVKITHARLTRVRR